jgi:selenide, water dikinase
VNEGDAALERDAKPDAIAARDACTPLRIRMSWLPIAPGARISVMTTTTIIEKPRGTAPAASAMRLTEFSHGGGCGCKISPAVLRDIIARSAPGLIPGDLLVGIETDDDAAVYRINDRQAIVATTDFFMPIVDEPFDFGAIAATNALSDVYAMGARPLFALAIVAMPVDRLPVETIRRILEGGEWVCAKAGVPIAGGHTIDSVEPIYGLVAIGLVDPAQIKRNRGAMPGDTLVLGKPIGVGIYSAALKKQKLAAARYQAMLATATQLNTPGMALGSMPGVHALTDVTGFGLLGHLLEICRASSVGATISASRIPLLPDATSLAAAGFVTGASGRNWASYGAEVEGELDATTRALLTDPQTSGGLLVACSADAVDGVLGAFRADGFDSASVIGRIVAGPPRVAVDSGSAGSVVARGKGSVA